MAGVAPSLPVSAVEIGKYGPPSGGSTTAPLEIARAAVEGPVPSLAEVDGLLGDDRTGAQAADGGQVPDLGRRRRRTRPGPVRPSPRRTACRSPGSPGRGTGGHRTGPGRTGRTARRRRSRAPWWWARPGRPAAGRSGSGASPGRPRCGRRRGRLPRAVSCGCWTATPQGTSSRHGRQARQLVEGDGRLEVGDARDDRQRELRGERRRRAGRFGRRRLP